MKKSKRFAALFAAVLMAITMFSLNSYLNLQLLPYEELYGKGEGENYPNERD